MPLLFDIYSVDLLTPSVLADIIGKLKFVFHIIIINNIPSIITGVGNIINILVLICNI